MKSSFVGYAFEHNADLSGDVKVTDVATGESMIVSGLALFLFVADYAKREQMVKLSIQTAPEVLGVGQPLAYPTE